MSDIAWAIAAPGLLRVDAPPTWVDDDGIVYLTPRTSCRLKYRHRTAKALCEYVWRRDGGCCVRCHRRGSPDVWIQVDHVIALRAGGAHHPSNLQLLCNHCNSQKGGLVDMPAIRAYPGQA